MLGILGNYKWNGFDSSGEHCQNKYGTGNPQWLAKSLSRYAILTRYCKTVGIKFRSLVSKWCSISLGEIFVVWPRIIFEISLFHHFDIIYHTILSLISADIGQLIEIVSCFIKHGKLDSTSIEQDIHFTMPTWLFNMLMLTKKWTLVHMCPFMCHLYMLHLRRACLQLQNA